jgi:hypothetical protein
LTHIQILVARTALGVLLGGASMIAVSIRRLRTISCGSFNRVINAAFISSRLVVYLAIFFVLRIVPRGDVVLFYWPEATSALHHLLPYRDFTSSYAPLHPYLDAAWLHLYPSPLSIIFSAICVEMFVLPLWLHFGRIFLSEQQVRSGALLYLTSVLSLQFVTIDGQDNVIIAVLLVVSLALVYRSRLFASGVVVGFAASLVKFLPLLYIPVFFIIVSKRWRWLTGACSVLVLVYGGFLLFSIPIFQPLMTEGGMRSAGNLPYLVEGVTGMTLPSIFWDALALIVLFVVFGLIVSAARLASPASRLRILTFGFAALTLALVLFAKKSWPPYLMMAFFPICVLVRAEKLMTSIFAVFQLVAVVSMSYWATILSQFSATDFHKGLMTRQSNCLVFLAIQILLVVGYAWLLGESIRHIREASQPNLPEIQEAFEIA